MSHSSRPGYGGSSTNKKGVNTSTYTPKPRNTGVNSDDRKKTIKELDSLIKKPVNNKIIKTNAKKDKGIMARKKAAQSMASQGILNLAGDVTANEKGRDSQFKQYDFDDRVNYNYNRKTTYADKDTKIKKDQITETKGSGVNKKRVTTKDTNYKPSFLSKTRDLAIKAGVPVVFSQFGYSLMGGKKENVPLTINSFNKKELSYIKDEALKSIKERFGLRQNYDFTNLKNTKPITVNYWAGNPLDVTDRDTTFAEKSVGSTLGAATVFINNEGELIVTDYYDWKTGVDLTNPSTGEAPVNLEEWRYTVRKQSEFYLFNREGDGLNQDYVRPYEQDFHMYDGVKEKIESDVYRLSQIFMDAAESLANIIGPEKYEQKNIFQVPEEKRTILNLGKI
jgi:hypothetical protein|tara:strand:+ start:17 stop:1195 length:1179 start_codon:yes stop_codon:yes gene_type:complete